MKAGVDAIGWGSDGLVPAVAQDSVTGEVLMLAWMNREALDRTLETGFAHFWSRNRNCLWRKGDTSGNTLRVNRVNTDCDVDAILLQVTPAGPACHTGARSCFTGSIEGPGIVTSESLLPGLVLGRLSDVISSRLASPVEGSYTSALAAGGVPAAARKVGEEAVEVILAASGEGDSRLVEESADLVYHLLVLLALRRLSFSDVAGELAGRMKHEVTSPD